MHVQCISQEIEPVGDLCLYLHISECVSVSLFITRIGSCGNGGPPSAIYKLEAQERQGYSLELGC